MASGPQKADIEAVFQRLRALPTNKVSRKTLCLFKTKIFTV